LKKLTLLKTKHTFKHRHVTQCGDRSWFGAEKKKVETYYELRQLGS